MIKNELDLRNAWVQKGIGFHKLLQSIENRDQCGSDVENKQPFLFPVFICLFET